MSLTTEHYVFHCEECFLAENNIADIAKLQEDCYSYIADFLDTTAIGKIHYHFYSTAVEVGKQYAAATDCDDDEPCNGFAISCFESKDGLNHIYAVYNDEVKCIGFHEDAHMISYSINRPNSKFIREGLAMFFDRYWWGIDNISWVRWHIEQNKYPSIESLMHDEIFDKHEETLTYTFAGAFTEYLVIRYGKDKYTEFYRICTENVNSDFQGIFKIALSEIEKEFISYVKMFKLRDEICKIISVDTVAE